MKIGTFKEAWKKYWMQYLAWIGIAFLLLYKTACHGGMPQSVLYENQFELSNLSKFYTMNAEYDKCLTYTQKRDFHKKNAERCFNDARDMCWYLPGATRDKSFYAFTNLAILGSPGEARSKLITALITTLIQYGADVIDEWANINTKLNWAQYHWEQHEFYCEVVRNGNL